LKEPKVLLTMPPDVTARESRLEQKRIGQHRIKGEVAPEEDALAIELLS